MRRHGVCVCVGGGWGVVGVPTFNRAYNMGHVTNNDSVAIKV